MDHQEIVSRIRRWGGVTSDALLDPPCQIFSHPNLEGIIGYRPTSGCAVVLGDPVCSLNEMPKLVHAFHQFCEEQRLQIIYLIASENFASWAMQHVCKAKIEFGAELFLDPQCDPLRGHGTHASLIRRKVRHALREGASITEYLSLDEKLEQAMEQLSYAWLRSRRGAQIHISNVYLFKHRHGKRWFFARHKDQIVGVVVLNRLDESNGWLLNHLMLSPIAPHGTPELLIILALEALRNEGCSYASFGAVEENKLGHMEGFSKFSTSIIRLLYQSAYYLLHLNGRKMFWAKFNPQAKPAFLLFNQGHVGLSELRALMKTMHVSFRLSG